MRSDEIVVIANDVVPGMSLPVASPGLRAWGLARGLRRHGRQVTVAVDARVVRRAWRRRGLPPPHQPETVVASPPQIGDLIRARKPRAVIIANARPTEELGDIGDTALIYDFFAAKMLEFREDAWEGQDASLAEFRRRKLDALRRSAGAIVNGAKKLSYVDAWLEEAGCPHTPRVVVNMPVEPYGPSSYVGGPVHVVVAGYIHPWSPPGDWSEAVSPFVRDGSIVLHLVVGAHWTGHRAPSVLPQTFGNLAALDGVRRHGVMDYGHFRRFMATCHVSLDLFERNPERELAFVTRTAVALAGGLPVIHVPFTEVSPLIERANAGWLLNCEDLDSLTSALKAATEDPDALTRKQAGARQISSDLDPVNAASPLDELLETIG